VLTNDGTATLDHAIISNNSGGALQNSGSIGITDSTITNNVGPFTTGGIDNAGTLQLATSTLSGNWAASSSDVVGALRTSGTATLVNVTVADNNITNVAWDDCGGPFSGAAGIKVEGGHVTARNLTITGNAVDNDVGSLCPPGVPPLVGGVLVSSGASLRLANSVIAGNTASGGPAPLDCQGTISSLGYDLLQRKTTGCVVTGTTTGNVYGKSPMLVTLANNGGFAQTEMPQSGSPVIDKGNPAAPSTVTAACPLFDERSIARPRDGNGDGIKRCDIGAVEK
jgi:hypothetical protein